MNLLIGGWPWIAYEVMNEVMKEVARRKKNEEEHDRYLKRTIPLRLDVLTCTGGLCD